MGKFWYVPVACLVLATSALLAFNHVDSWDLKASVGTCGGFGTKYIKEVPTRVFDAIDDYFNGIKGGSAIYNYATEVNPQRESTIPHTCKGLGNSVDPGYKNGNSITPLQLTEIKAKRLHYSGVIPPGATKALELNIGFLVPTPKAIVQNTEINSFLVKNNYQIISSKTIIAALYPKYGWKVVFVFPLQHAGYATS